MQELCPFSCSSPRLSIVRGHLLSPRRTILQERLNSSKSHRAVLRGMAGMVSVAARGRREGFQSAVNVLNIVQYWQVHFWTPF